MFQKKISAIVLAVTMMVGTIQPAFAVVHTPQSFTGNLPIVYDLEELETRTITWYPFNDIEDGQKKLAFAFVKKPKSLVSVKYNSNPNAQLSDSGTVDVATGEYQVLEPYNPQAGGSYVYGVKITEPKDGVYFVTVNTDDGNKTCSSTFVGADTTPPVLDMNSLDMEFLFGKNKLRFTPVVTDAQTPEGVTIKYATISLADTDKEVENWLSASNSVPVEVDYISGGMVLLVRCSDTHGNSKTYGILAINPTIEGEKLITHDIVRSYDGTGAVNGLDVTLHYNPDEFEASTGATVSFSKVSGSEDGFNLYPAPFEKDRTFKLSASGTYHIYMDFPIKKAITTNGVSGTLQTTLHYDLEIDATEIGSNAKPDINIKPGTGNSVIQTTLDGATIHYLVTDSNRSGVFQLSEFTSEKSKTITVPNPDLTDSAKIILAYSEKDGVRSEMKAILLVDEDQMLTLGPQKVGQQVAERYVNLEYLKIIGANENEYVKTSNLDWVETPDRILNGSDILDENYFIATENKEYSAQIIGEVKVDVWDALGTGSPEAIASVNTTKTYSETGIFDEQTLPEVTHTQTPTEWTNKNVTVEVTLTPKGSQTADQWSTDDFIATVQDGVLKGTFEVEMNKTVDLAFNGPEGATVTHQVTVTNIDKQEPTVDFLEFDNETISKDPILVTVKVADLGGSQIKSVTVPTMDGIATHTPYDPASGTIVLEISKNITGLVVSAEDNAGNIGKSEELTITNIDTVAPVINISHSPEVWTNGNVTVTIVVEDDNLESVELSGGLGNFTPEEIAAKTATRVVSVNQTITVTATDRATNSSTEQDVIDEIDKVDPEIKVDRVSGGFTAEYTDDLSGIKDKQYAFLYTADVSGASWQEYTGKITPDGSNVYIVFRATDNAGNEYVSPVMTVFDIDRYVTIKHSPEEMTAQDVNVSIEINWDLVFGEIADETDTSGVTISDVTGEGFGTYTGSFDGSAGTGSFAVNHNDTYSWTIEGMPYGSGTIDIPISYKISNVDKLPPRITSVNVGHYDDLPTYIWFAAEDCGIAGTDETVSGVKDAYLVTKAVADGLSDIVTGAVSGQKISIGSDGTGFIQITSTDAQEYWLVVLDGVGNAAKVKLDTSRISAEAQKTETTDPGWINTDAKFNITIPAKDALLVGYEYDGTIVDSSTGSAMFEENGYYKVNSLYALGNVELTWTNPQPNSTVVADQGSFIAGSEDLPVFPQVTDDAVVEEHNIGKYDWKIPTTILVDNIDKTPPELTIDDGGLNGIGNSEITVTVTAQEPETSKVPTDVSGIKTIEYKIGDSAPVTVANSSASFVVSSDDIVTITTEDNAGNKTTKTYQAQIDTEAPLLTYTTNPSKSSWTTKDVVVDAVITDNLSGIDTQKLVFPKDLVLNGTPSTVNPLEHRYQFRVSKNGTFNVETVDKAGNRAVYPIVIGNIDKEDPTISVSATPTEETYGSVTITVKVKDDLSGVDYVLIPDGSKKTPDASGNVSYKVNGNGTFEFEVFDKAGNSNSQKITVDNIIVEISRPQDSQLEEVDENSNVYTRIETDWFSKKLTVKPVAYPRDEIDFYEYSLKKISDVDDEVDNPKWKTTHSEPKIEIPSSGIWSLQIKATNESGVESEITEYIILMDTDKPVSKNYKTTNSYISFTAYDAHSGIDYCDCETCGETADADGDIKCYGKKGEKHKYVMYDLAGNKSTETHVIGDHGDTGTYDGEDDDEDIVVDKDKPTTSKPVNPPTGLTIGGLN